MDDGTYVWGTNINTSQLRNQIESFIKQFTWVRVLACLKGREAVGATVRGLQYVPIACVGRRRTLGVVEG